MILRLTRNNFTAPTYSRTGPGALLLRRSASELGYISEFLGRFSKFSEVWYVPTLQRVERESAELPEAQRLPDFPFRDDPHDAPRQAMRIQLTRASLEARGIFLESVWDYTF